ncbi:MAG: sigma-70 family RNA polymerase sigma factor [Clostridiales bacterium]|nr:sigma-70 family RNA polymerase sigma factor [Clostridiales bacterium]
MLDNITEISILYDFYGVLLPPKQREIFHLYYEDNLSLGEIAEEYGLTRQGIHETVKRGEKKLREFEAKLRLIHKFEKEEEIIEKLKKDIEQIIYVHKEDSELTAKLEQIKERITKLNQ